MSNSNLSFQEFPALSKEDWLTQISKELKGAELSSMDSRPEPDILLKPAYTSVDLPETQPIPARPQSHIDLIEVVEVSNGKESNKYLLELLNKGCSGLLLFLQKGVVLKDLLEGVYIEHIAIHYVSDGEAVQVAGQLAAVISERGLDPKEVRGSINADPIENLARTGKWFRDEASDFDSLSQIIKIGPGNLRTLCVNANIYHNAGARTTTELGTALAHAHEYIARFGVESASSVWMNLAIGRNYLLQIAKFRAMRLLWARMISSYTSETIPLHIYAETGWRNKTIYDPNVNMLRTTTEGMSAMLGGIDEICINPFDMTFRTPTPLAQRIARNQALVMQYESFAAKVNDPAAGSYAIENLTHQLCEKAWAVFAEIESKGGLIETLKSGWIQDRIESEAATEQEAFDRGDISLVGTNKFPNKEEKMNDLIEYPMFASAAGEEVIRKVRMIRLSEKSEQARLKEEQS